MIEFKEYNRDNDLHFYEATENVGNYPPALFDLDKLKADKGKHIYNVETQKYEDNYVRCLKLEPFDVFEIYDREAAFEEAKKLQDRGQNVSVVFASNGKIYIQLLTENDLFVHNPLV